MASIRQTDSAWHIRFRRKGRKEIVLTYPLTLQRKTIERKKIILEEKQAMGEFDPWQDSDLELVIGVAVRQYIRHNRQSGNWSAATIKTNTSRLDKLSSFFGTSIYQVEQQDITDHLWNLDVHPITKKGHRSAWNAFFSWLHKEHGTDKIVVDIPVRDKITIRNESKTKYLTRNEVHRICQAIRFDHRQIDGMYSYQKGKGADFYCDLIWFLFYSLLRRNELVKLRGKHYHKGRLKVHGKGRRIETIDLPPPADAIIQRYITGADDPIFVTNMNRAKIHLKRGMELAFGEQRGLFHTFRHSGIVHYLSEGIPVQFVSKLARHRSIQITLDQYGDVIPDQMKSVFSGISHIK